MLPKIMRRTIRAPKFDERANCWKVIESDDSWSYHAHEDAAWEFIAKLGAMGHRVPVREDEGR